MRLVGRIVLLAVLALVALFVVRCSGPAQFAPSLDRVVGLQVDDGRLTVLMGATCHDVTEVVLVFSGKPDGTPDRAILESYTPNTVDRVSVGQSVVVDGFEVTETLPPGFDWRDYSEADVILGGSGSEAGGASVDLETVKKDGAKHEGDGTAYVRGEGWLTPAQVAAGDAKTFLTACTPDPEDEND